MAEPRLFYEKEAEERKNEILDEAAALFAKKGYDGTSIGDILEKVGVARGTLYYHFRSKEEILDALVERISNSIIANAKKAAGNKEHSVVDRIVESVSCLKPQSEIGDEIFEQVHKPQNALMHQKMELIMIKGAIPVIAELIAEGVEEKTFNTKYPQNVAELLIGYSLTFFDENFEQTEEELRTRVKAFIYNAERVLGAKEGSLEKPFLKIIKQTSKI